jgi:hypothetical protein
MSWEHMMDEDSGMEQSRGVSLSHTSSFHTMEKMNRIWISEQRVHEHRVPIFQTPCPSRMLTYSIRYHWDECTPNMKGYNPAEFRLVPGISVISRA